MIKRLILLDKKGDIIESMVAEIAESSASFLHIVISLAVLLFAAKLFAELFHRIKMPVVLGELLAGIIVGPLLWEDCLSLMENL